jgi:hypothetical protein
MPEGTLRRIRAKLSWVSFLVVVTITIASIAMPARPTAAGSNGNQIRFSVADGTFTYLKIVGENQYGELTTWEVGNQKRSMYYADTTSYWWKGTIVLKFYSSTYGWRDCILDYLKEPVNGDLVPVIYTEGRGCSGDSGSSYGYAKEVDLFYRVLFSEEDSLLLVGEVDNAVNALECTKEIVEGLKKNGTMGRVVAVIKVGKSCGGLVLDQVNDILKKYNNKVEFK